SYVSSLKMPADRAANWQELRAASERARGRGAPRAEIVPDRDRRHGRIARTRIVSAARIRLDQRPFKEIICHDISEFESSLPSQAVRSLWPMSGLQKSA